MNGQPPFDEGEGTGGRRRAEMGRGGAWHGLGRCLTGTGLLSGVGDATGRQPGCLGAAGAVCHAGLVQRAQEREHERMSADIGRPAERDGGECSVNCKRFPP
jgi:hypothetical protein